MVGSILTPLNNSPAYKTAILLLTEVNTLSDDENNFSAHGGFSMG
jgi:hypothetical protein